MAEPNETNPPSDEILLQRFQYGDYDAATQLYLRYAQRLRSLALKECSPKLARHIGVDDIVQSAFGSFFRKAKDGQYHVPDGNELWGLLLVITLNKIRAKALHYQRDKRDLRRTTIAGLEDWLESGRSSDKAAYAFLKLIVQETMAKFPADERAIFCLRIDGHDVDQIAAQTGRPKRTVERRLQEFRALLGGALEEGEDKPG